MAFYRGPRIITDGLSVYFDAKNIKSYSGSGNNWYDLINRNRYVSSGTYLPLYTTLGGVTCFNFNQVGSSFSNSSFFTSGFPSTSGSGSELTIDVWIYLNASELQADDRANIIQGASAWYESINKTSLKLSNYWYGKTNEGYHETTSSLSRGTWYNLVSVWTQSELYQFVNTIKTVATTSGVSANGSLSLSIGQEGAGRQFSGGIASIKLYNRALSDSEVLQNYNATKTRFGL